jgi:hypothetical protein
MSVSPIRCRQCGATIDANVFSDEPQFCPQCGQAVARGVTQPGDAAAPNSTGVDHGRAAYNIVTDVAAGPNVRLKDNLFQALAIFVAAVLGVMIGWLVSPAKAEGAILGGVAGLLIGLLGSGTFLMVYRFIRHVSGKHD